MWEIHDQRMRKLKQIYQKQSKKTQRRLQEIFDSFQIDFKDFYKIADKKQKQRINDYIDEWQEDGLLKGQFGLLARNIRNRQNVKNSEILELLIYSAYVQEQNRLDDIEMETFKEETNYYYQEGQKEVNNTLKKKKQISVIPDTLYLSLLMLPAIKGYMWEEYKQAMAKYNADQIYRQATINLQQEKPLKIDSDAFQNIIMKGLNQKININGDKISGDIDLLTIGLDNQAKQEGMCRLDPNAKVQFVAVEDNVTTKMCKSLDGQIFNAHEWNKFRRYSAINDHEMEYRCYGLIIGLNCPPIDDHFHWCRSTIRYVANIQHSEYNRADYIRKNKITDNRTLDEKIKKAKTKFPLYIQEFIDKTPIEIVGRNKNNHYLDGKLYLLNDATEDEIIHEIGHIIEDKLNIANDAKYQNILKNSIGEIDVMNNSIGSIKGYDEDKYEFLLTGDNFVSDYQRRVYNIDIEKKSRIDYLKGEFNYNVFRDYLPEGLKYYFIDRQMLKNKNIELYKYIEEVLHERK